MRAGTRRDRWSSTGIEGKEKREWRVLLSGFRLQLMEWRAGARLEVHLYQVCLCHGWELS
jgi:hypothetical protein